MSKHAHFFSPIQSKSPTSLGGMSQSYKLAMPGVGQSRNTTNVSDLDDCTSRLSKPNMATSYILGRNSKRLRDKIISKSKGSNMICGI